MRGDGEKFWACYCEQLFQTVTSGLCNCTYPFMTDLHYGRWGERLKWLEAAIPADMLYDSPFCPV